MGGTHDIPDLDRKGLREFAFTIGSIVAVLFGLVVPWWLDRPFPLWPWIVSGTLIGWGLVIPITLRRVYRAWMKIGLLLNMVTSPLVMAIVFYVVITPVGLIRRMSGYRLPDHRDPNLKSYRVNGRATDSSDLTRPF